MDKKNLLTVAGIVAVVGGSVALYFGGATEGMITSLVGGVFVLIGLVVAFFKKA